MFNNLKLKPVYNTYEDDIIQDFYNPVLENSITYDRVSAYFTAKALATYSKGISNLVKNNGRVRFIISHQIAEKDYDLILKGYDERSELNKDILEYFLKDELTTEDEKRLSNLAFLIKNNIVDIKIAFVKKGIFHDKFGIMFDKNNNIIYFRGSNNETEAAIKSNYESFEVSSSINNDEFENEKIQIAINQFDDLWNNKINNILTLDIPTIVNNEIIKYDKGEPISEYEISYPNTLVFDMLDLKLTCRKYVDFEVEDDKNSYYKIRVKNYVKRFIKKSDKTMITFIDNISYIDILNIVGMFKKYGVKHNFNVIMSSKLLNYIDTKNIYIDKRNKLGTDIKNKEDYLIEKFNEFEEILDVEMERKLRPQQLWDAFHIACMIKSANFSVPGAGKTSIVYGAYAYLNCKKINKVNKIIMIGPKNSFLAWKEEFVENFGMKKELKLFNIHDKETFSGDKIKHLRLNSGKNNLILVNYEALPKLKEILEEIIDDKTMLVFDEVHKIKGITGVRAKVAIEISKNVKYKIVLTGTPIPNGYEDLFNMLNLLYGEEYKAFFNKKSEELRNLSESEQDVFNKKIFPFFCRTTKKMLSIPIPNKDIIITSNMNKNEKELFKLIYDKYSHNILSLYIRLMQASTNPSLLLKALNGSEIINILGRNDDTDDEELINENIKSYVEDNLNTTPLSLSSYELINKCGVSTKFTAGINLIRKLAEENKQVIVWTIFNDTIYRIKEECDNLNLKSKIINGSVPQNEREILINEFKNKKFNILITNPQTLAESVSLHKTCHDAIYFEYSFNLTHMLQSKDRINRLGLPDNQYTQYYYLRLKNDEDIFDSLDQKIYERLKEKEKIMIDAIEGTSIKRIEFNDIEELKTILNKK